MDRGTDKREEAVSLPPGVAAGEATPLLKVFARLKQRRFGRFIVRWVLGARKASGSGFRSSNDNARSWPNACFRLTFHARPARLGRGRRYR